MTFHLVTYLIFLKIFYHVKLILNTLYYWKPAEFSLMHALIGFLKYLGAFWTNVSPIPIF